MGVSLLLGLTPKKPPTNWEKLTKHLLKNLIFSDPDFVKNGTFSQNGRQNRTSRSQLCPFSSIKKFTASTETLKVKNQPQKLEILKKSRRPKKNQKKPSAKTSKTDFPWLQINFWTLPIEPQRRPDQHKTSPESGFDHPDPRYITQLFPTKPEAFNFLLPLVNLR